MPAKYNLFVGQVEKDSQITFQSEETNLSALKKWFKEHHDTDLPLVYRYHPSEKSYDSALIIERFCYANGIIISNYASIISALESAVTVTLINSTSGMHALLLGKDVKVLGRAIYEHWNRYNTYYFATEVLNDDL
ncbi:capsular polysaccharide export protein, LipB/KpsS family [Pseudopelagicola sp. nBUS_19]|uniref:capsular polysaccharide export protein, LipB/KpsS family n=1 Tax=Pseudopelagicola sp. nBUS_19 TaxID=3395316 RepID=UPI003EBAE3FE